MNALAEIYKHVKNKWESGDSLKKLNEYLKEQLGNHRTALQSLTDKLIKGIYALFSFKL